MIKLNRWQKILLILNVLWIIWCLTTTDGKNNGYELMAEEPRVNVIEIYDIGNENVTYMYEMKGEYAEVEESETGICYYIEDAGISVYIDESGIRIYLDSSYIRNEGEIDRVYLVDENGEWYLEKKEYEKQ